MNLVLNERLLRTCKTVFHSLGEFVDENWGPDEIPEWDSINHLNLVLALTEEFGITFDLNEILMMETLRDIQQIVEQKLMEN